MTPLLKYAGWALCLLIFQCSAAQPSLRYLEKLDIEDGLSSNLVSGIVQDGNGYLWIATHDGLNRYDGTEVVRFFSDPSDPSSLPDNFIFRMIRLDSFHLAIGTFHGLSIADTRDGKFHNVLFPVPSPRPGKTKDAGRPFTREELMLWEGYNNVIEYLETDSRGDLWIGTPVSLLCFNKAMQLIYSCYLPCSPGDLHGKRLSFVRQIIPLATTFPLSSQEVSQNPADDVLILFSSGWRVWQRETGNLSAIHSYRSGQLDFLRNMGYGGQCFQVYDRYLVYMADLTDSVFVFDEITGRSAVCKFYEANHPTGAFNYNPWQLRISALDSGWIAFSYRTRGMVLLHLKEGSGKLLLVFYPKRYFPENTFKEVIPDREGNWWVTTDEDGLLKISRGKQNFEQFDLKDPGEQLRSAHEVASLNMIGGELYVCSYGDGLYQLNPRTGSIEHHSVVLQQRKRTVPTGSAVNYLWNISHYRGDTLWIGTQSGLIWYDTGKKIFGRLSIPHPSILDSVAITTQFTDSRGCVWMGLGGGNGLCVYNPGSRQFGWAPNRPGGYPFRYPTAAVEDREGDIWLLNDDAASLVHWHRRTGVFEVVTPGPLLGNTKRFTDGFYLDRQDVIWYAVEGIGLLRYDTRTGRTRVYNHQEGLSTSSVNAITGDDANRIWLATPEGLTCFDPLTNRFMNYNQKQGLHANYLSSGFFYDSSAHMMYAGTTGRIFRFQLRGFQPPRLPLPVRITGIVINGKPLHLAGDHILHIPYRNNDVSIRFTGINLTDGHDNRYAYRLIRGGNSAKSWINIGRQRQIRLADLEPGDYDFTVKAAREEGEWSPQTAHLHFTVITPFNRSVWFYLIVALFAFSLLYGWYRYRLNEVLKLERMRNQISHDLHDEIGSHLTDISLLSVLAGRRLGDNEQLKNILNRIGEDSHHISESMREIIWSVNPRNDSLKYAMSYLLRYASGMLEARSMEVEASVPETEITRLNMYQRRDLVLIFKELINNIARHSDAGKVIIALKEEGRQLCLQISDDGKGFDPLKSTQGNGLQNIQERALRHHWKLEIHSVPGRGTSTRLYLRST